MGDRIMEQPRKTDDHGCDAMRYMVHFVDGKQAQLSSAVFGQRTKHTFAGGKPTSGPADKMDFWKNTLHGSNGQQPGQR